MEKLSQEKMLQIKAAMFVSKKAEPLFDDIKEVLSSLEQPDKTDVRKAESVEQSVTDNFRFDVSSKTLENELETLIRRHFKFSDEEENWIIQEIIAHRLSDNLLFYLLREGYGRKLWPVDPIVNAVIDGQLSVSFLYSLFHKHYNFSDDVLVLIVQAAIEKKILTGLIETMVLEAYNIPEPVKKLIVDAVVIGNLKKYYLELLIDYRYDFSELLCRDIIFGIIEGKLSPDVLQMMLDSGYEFALGNWRLMFNSGIDVMVKACLKKYYPELENML